MLCRDVGGAILEPFCASYEINYVGAIENGNFSMEERQ
jgi:hypothetical protein